MNIWSAVKTLTGVYSIPIRREDLEFLFYDDIMQLGHAQNGADFPTLFHNNSPEGSGTMRYAVQLCISAVYQWCAVNSGSARSGKYVGSLVCAYIPWVGK